MTDHLSPRQRSRLMSKIRSEGSRPERLLQQMIRRSAGSRVRCNVRGLPGTPDVVVHALRLAVFMEGCLWHRCPVHYREPKSNVEFWRAKIRKNVARDRRNGRELRRLGWTVWRIWEHDLKPSTAKRTARNVRRRLRRLALLCRVPA